MTLSWDEYKKKKRKEFGTLIFKGIGQQKTTPRYEGIEPPIKKYNIHKRTLPVGVPPIDKIVIFSVSKAEAEWWIDKRLKAKCYENGVDDSKTLVYYDIIPVDATPKERSIYYNTHPVTTEEVPGFKAPRRIN